MQQQQTGIAATTKTPEPDPLEVYAKKVRMKSKKIKWSWIQFGIITVPLCLVSIGISWDFPVQGKLFVWGIVFLLIGAAAVGLINRIEPWKED